MEVIVRDPTASPGSADLELVPGKNLITGSASLARQIGTLTSLEEDLLTLGAAVFATDLATKRGERENIARDIHLVVPVVNHTAFTHLSEDVSTILYILGHDNWAVDFVRK